MHDTYRKMLKMTQDSPIDIKVNTNKGAKTTRAKTIGLVIFPDEPDSLMHNNKNH